MMSILLMKSQHPCYFVFCVFCVYIVNVLGNEKTSLITSYAKVSMSGNNKQNNETNEGRSYLAGQTLWTQRTDAHVSKQQNPIHRVYPQQYPVYTPTKVVPEKIGNSYEKLPAKGEVIIEDRFTLSRPYFTYDPEKKKPDLSYLPPPSPSNTQSTPLSQPTMAPPLPPPPSKDTQPPIAPPDTPNQTPDTGPTGLYDSPYSSYNPPNFPSSYFYPKPDDKEKNNNPVYPPLAPSRIPEKTEEKKPDLPPYLEYNPYEHHHKPETKPSTAHGYLPPYLEYNPMKDMKPPEITSPDMDHHHHHHPEITSPDMDHHHHDMKPPESMPPTMDNTPDEMKPPKFPAYLYHPPTGPDDDSKTNGIPPYLEYNPYEHKGNDDDKGPTITATIKPTGDEFYPKLPAYLDHDPHSFNPHDFYHFPLYHEIKPITPPPTTTQEPEKRDSKRPYTYYYLGRKLWYIPLYFSVYFIVYIFVLVIKSIARHKITFNQYFEDSRKFNGDESMEIITERVLTNIETATKKFSPN